MLQKIIVRDLNHAPVKWIEVNRDPDFTGLPREISFHGREGEKVSNILLDYYPQGTGPKVTNIHGYPVGFYGNSSDYDFCHGHRFFYGHDECSLFKTLKTIQLSRGTGVNLYYGFNRCGSLINGSGSDGGGGIRIAGIVMRDSTSGREDEISYQYRGEVHVLPRLSNRLVIEYQAGFSDVLCFDRLYNSGPGAYAKTGNNGVYCQMVLERVVGKGRTEYYFGVPDHSGSTYNHWYVGKLLGTCSYDEDSRLREVTRYEYDDSLALPGRLDLLQIQRCEYYVTPDDLDKYRGDSSCYFRENMEKRLTPVVPLDLSYRMTCNYGVFLKRVSKYTFEGIKPSDNLSYFRESPFYTRTEFEYDLSRSTFPVRTTVTRGDGTKRVEIVKRALDFDDGADSCVSLLKASNMVGFPLQTRSLVVEPDGSERLLVERVNRYKSVERPASASVLLAAELECFSSGEGAGVGNGFFGYPRALYDSTVYHYASWGDWQPVSIDARGDRTEVRYHAWTGARILVSPYVPENSVAAYDFHDGMRVYYGREFVLPNAASLKYGLFVLASSPSSVRVVLEIHTPGGVVTREFVTRDGCLGPQRFDLDLTGVTGISKIRLSDRYDCPKYVALVPAGGEFEATSYNADGTVYCRFDHNCQAERYEYDSAGRMVKVFDRDGNLLKENSYNVVVQSF